MQNKSIARIIPIRDIHKGKYIKEEGWKSSYIQIGDLQAGRFNIIGIIVEKDEQSITLDDSTGTIKAFSFEGPIFSAYNIGDIVILIGRPRLFGEQKYIVPEIVKPLKEKEWIRYRSLCWGERKPEPVVEKKAEETVSEQDFDLDLIIDAIKKLDSGEGVTVDEIGKEIRKEDFDQHMIGLVERGEIFEIRPGRFKILE